MPKILKTAPVASETVAMDTAPVAAPVASETVAMDTATVETVNLATVETLHGATVDLATVETVNLATVETVETLHGATLDPVDRITLPAPVDLTPYGIALHATRMHVESGRKFFHRLAAFGYDAMMHGDEIEAVVSKMETIMHTAKMEVATIKGYKSRLKACVAHWKWVQIGDESYTDYLTRTEGQFWDAWKSIKNMVASGYPVIVGALNAPAATPVNSLSSPDDGTKDAEDAEDAEALHGATVEAVAVEVETVAEAVEVETVAEAVEVETVATDDYGKSVEISDIDLIEMLAARLFNLSDVNLDRLFYMANDERKERELRAIDAQLDAIANMPDMVENVA